MMAKWRTAKEASWATEGSKLRRRYPEYADFEAWMDKQCAKVRPIHTMYIKYDRPFI